MTRTLDKNFFMIQMRKEINLMKKSEAMNRWLLVVQLMKKTANSELLLTIVCLNSKIISKKDR